jgi:hypothetical protein
LLKFNKYAEKGIKTYLQSGVESLKKQTYLNEVNKSNANSIPNSIIFLLSGLKNCFILISSQ